MNTSLSNWTRFASMMIVVFLLSAWPVSAFAQEAPPAPDAARSSTRRGAPPGVCGLDQASTLGGPSVDRSGCPRPVGPPGPVPRLADGKPDLSGIWNGFGGSGGQGPMQPWAAKIVADHRAKGGAEDYEARCLPGGPPRAAPYHTSLFSTPNLVLMLFEGNTHMYRQFFVDGSTHPKNLKPTFYGDSRAHWDGDTLVVDTIGFREDSWYDFAGTPHTKQMHLTETFRRRDFGNLEMKVTIEDPGALTMPWVI
ncbi:MAG TPA: hypothetical protein VHZ74_00040, partial [Bryobacteraceae bacterium]|nr:hypothetical protein [Bryobacteraceae bacterium]